MTHRVLILLLAPAALLACQPQTIDTPTGSNYGSVSQSQTNTGLDASSLIITTSEVGKLDPEDMIDRMIAEMDALSGALGRSETYADAASLTKQVSMAGQNYRTMIGRVMRERDAGNEAVLRRLNQREARLRRAHAELMDTGRKTTSRFPETKRELGEALHKFEFGMLATRSSDRNRPANSRDEAAPR